LSAGKAILIAVLILISLHLLLYSILKRSIAAAKREKEKERGIDP
jgi:hypothetical protein